MNKKNLHLRKGFTLIELLVVIAIIGLLSSVVLASLNTARGKARDAIRKQEMREIQSALNLYYSDFGSYPLPNPGSWGGISTVPCGPGNGQTGGANAYILGLTPKYMGTLPVDPGPAGSCNGIMYASDGINYKLLDHQSYEGTYPTAGQEFYDPLRKTWSIMLCSGDLTTCNTW